jgi:four helix bundle protein
MSSGDFRKLVVWQKGRDLTTQIYKWTDEGRIARDFGLRDQMRRAAVSVCSNIAEGNDRNADRDTAQFLYIAKGSAAELISLLDIAAAVGYIDSAEANRLIAASEEVARTLRGLIKTRTQTSPSRASRLAARG